jgi:hypothetical protein
MQVQKNHDRMAETLQHMKRDYYREVDHLRAQISLSKRDPNFEPDNVFFFDPSAYQIPAWEAVVEQLDDKRLQRELLAEQDGSSIRHIPIHMVCQNCRNRFQLGELQSVDETTQTEVLCNCDCVDQTTQTQAPDSCDTAVPVTPALVEPPSIEDAKPVEPPSIEDAKPVDAQDNEMVWSSLVGDRKDLIELTSQATQTDQVTEFPVVASGSNASHLCPADLHHLEDQGQKSKKSLPRPTATAMMGQNESSITGASIAEDSLQTVATKARRRAPHESHLAKASDNFASIPCANLSKASASLQQCFHAWKSRIVARRRRNTKKIAAQLVKRQLAAVEAHIKRMAFAGWRHAVMANATKPYPREEPSLGSEAELRAIQEPSANVTGERHLERPVSEPKLVARNDGSHNFRPSSEPTLASRGERRLHNLRPSCNPQLASHTEDHSKNAGPALRSPSATCSHQGTQSNGHAPIRHQFLGVNDSEERRKERRGTDIEEDKLRALDKMTKPYLRRGAHVPHSLRKNSKGGGEQNEASSRQRVQVQLTLFDADVDVSTHDSRCSPLSTPQDFFQQDNYKCNRFQRQAMRNGLTHVASLPAFGSAAQRSPTQSPQPLPGRPTCASQAKGRVSYASN